jgi:cobalamin biosynthesis Mg chelatase CobN
VRWALIVSTQGVSLDQIKINRSVPVRAQLLEDSVRVVDAQLDPGQLCRDQTVAAKWTVNFTGPDNGSVTFSARALSQQGRVLASADASSRVVTAVADKPSKSPSASSSASPAPSPTFTPEPAKTAVANPIESPSVDAAALARNTSGLNVLLPGLIVGAVLVFVGIALLMRLRSRSRRTKGGPPGWHQNTQTLPTGFYNMPRRGE